MFLGKRPDSTRQEILSDARRLSRFASSRGVLTDDLSRAIIRASAVTRAPHSPETAQEEESAQQAVLLACSKTLSKLGLSSIDEIDRYYSRPFSLVSLLARYLVLLIMLFCISLVIPLTFIFNQTSARVTQVRDLDELIRTQGVHAAGKGVQFSPQDTDRHPSGAAGNAVPDHRADMRSGIAAPEGELEANVLRLKSRVEFLIRPPRMMDMAQVVVNRLYKELFDPSGWIILMYYYHDDFDGNFDATDAPSVTKQLQIAENDFVFVSSILGTGLLPLLYGALGASVFVSRKYFLSSSSLYTIASPIGEILMRVGLGAAAGVAIGWFRLPTAAEQITSTPLAFAFVAGFSIDILFSLLERVISVFDFRREAGPRQL